MSAGSEEDRAVGRELGDMPTVHIHATTNTQSIKPQTFLSFKNTKSKIAVQVFFFKTVNANKT